MEFALVFTFFLGYMAIVFEHQLGVNKAASAILTGALCWVILMLGDASGQLTTNASFQTYLQEHHLPESLSTFKAFILEQLAFHFEEIAGILFFLLSAMTIVELIDAHHGFARISNLIRTKNRLALLWILAFFSFILSALLDNLTTSIVMVTLIRKLIHTKEERLFYAGMVIIAANSGGAFSPIGDVTTTMLWIGERISSKAVIGHVFWPSLISILVPLVFVSFQIPKSELKHLDDNKQSSASGSAAILIIGLLGLLFVPVFKTVTHLPPYLGILLVLALLWLVSEFVNKNKDTEERVRYSAAHALSRIDTPSILFFLGILLAVSALQTANLLVALAQVLEKAVGNQDAIVYLIGLASAVIDNVPLVAASMGMYNLSDFPLDSKLWQFLAYTSGTGGSILIIGSAAGVAVMGIEKITFFWYLKRMSLLAFLGYTAGAVTFLLLY